MHSKNSRASAATRLHAITFALIGSALLVSACAPQPIVSQAPARLYPSPESYLVNKNLKSVAQIYGSPSSVNTVGTTTFAKYSGTVRNGPGYQNICFLEIQADRETAQSAVLHLGAI